MGFLAVSSFGMSLLVELLHKRIWILRLDLKHLLIPFLLVLFTVMAVVTVACISTWLSCSKALTIELQAL